MAKNTESVSDLMQAYLHTLKPAELAQFRQELVQNLPTFLAVVTSEARQAAEREGKNGRSKELRQEKRGA